MILGGRLQAGKSGWNHGSSLLLRQNRSSCGRSNLGTHFDCGLVLETDLVEGSRDDLGQEVEFHFRVTVPLWIVFVVPPRQGESPGHVS